MQKSLEDQAGEISQALTDELNWARGRPPRSLQEIDSHYDALLAKMASLADIVALVAAGEH